MIKNIMGNSFLNEVPSLDHSKIGSRNESNAIVMFSGGLDSTVALWWALDSYKNVKIISVDYNQPHAIELDYAKKIAALTGQEYHVIKVDLPLDCYAIESRRTRGQACFLTCIAALNTGVEGADIIQGLLLEDGYADGERPFLDLFADMISLKSDIGAIGIATPLYALPEKADIIALAYYLGAPIKDSWTCRNPVNNQPCHECYQCKTREKAFLQFEKKYNVRWDCFEKWQNVMGSPYHPVIGAANIDIKALLDLVSETGAFEKGYPIYQYIAPDNTIRATSLIKAYNEKLPKVRGIAVHGKNEDGIRWEVCFFENGSIACTDNLPDSSVIENALLGEVHSIFKQ